MATKKECDRCGKQWDMEAIYETCSVSVVLPQWKNAPYNLEWDEKTRLEKAYELCQDCARTVVVLLVSKDNIVKST